MPTLIDDPVAQSTLALYGRCPRKWYNAVERGLRPTGSSAPMLIGSLFHLALAGGNRAVGADLAAGKSPEAAFTGPSFLAGADASVWGTDFDRDGLPLNATRVQRQLAFEMAQVYWTHVGSDDRYVALLSAEHPAVVTCGGLTVRCTIDAAWLTVEGTPDVHEYKTVPSVKGSVAFLWLDFQRGLYEFAAHELFGPDIRVCYRFVRREVPPGFGSRPLRLKKDGTAAKNNASQNLKDYVRCETRTKRSGAVLRFASEVRDLARSIKMHRSLGIWPRVRIKSGPEACEHCSYFALCCDEMDGKTVPTSALEREYTTLLPLAGTQQEALV